MSTPEAPEPTALPPEPAPAPPGDEARGPTFRAGDPCAFLQPGQAAGHMTVLRPGRTANVRGHQYRHDDLIGREVGAVVTSPQGGVHALVRPTLAAWTAFMPRFTRALDPREVAVVLAHGDVFAGARVLEAGVGSGGLTLALLRAVGVGGQLVSYDVRATSLETAAGNVAAWFGGPHPAHVLREQDVYAAIDPRDHDLDRVVLDVPEPWRVLPHARAALRPGGLFVAFLPTILQVHGLCEALRDTGVFPEIATWETLQRRWHVGRRSVRPEGDMSGHTGFVTVARLVASPMGARAAEGASDAEEAAGAADDGVGRGAGGAAE